MSAFRAGVDRFFTTSDGSLLGPYVDQTTSRQTTAIGCARELLRAGVHGVVLDLGCGEGDSQDELGNASGVELWIGLDLMQSPEVSSRTRSGNFVTFDGVNLPLVGAGIDMVYCHRVFEHVRHPEQLLQQVLSVLKPGGFLVGSTSQLEPFHSRSVWNYTAFGFVSMLRDAGFDHIVLRPGIDGMTLTVRRLFMFAGMAKLFRWWFAHESPLNAVLEGAGRVVSLTAKERAILKLVFAGQFVFEARRPC